MLKVKVQANGTVQLVHTDGDIELIAADDQHGFSNFIRKQIPPGFKEQLHFIFFWEGRAIMTLIIGAQLLAFIGIGVYRYWM